MSTAAKARGETCVRAVFVLTGCAKTFKWATNHIQDSTFKTWGTHSFSLSLIIMCILPVSKSFKGALSIEQDHSGQAYKAFFFIRII